MPHRSAFIHYILFIIGCTAWATICFIIPDFMDNPWNGFSGWSMFLLYTTAIGGATFLLLYIVALNKYAIAAFLPIFAIGGATVSYFRIAFKATITPIVIDASLHTNAGTISGIVSWQLVVWIMVNLLISIGFIGIRWYKIQPTHRIIQALAGLFLLIVYYNCNSRLYNSINQRYPYNIVHNFILYQEISKETTSERCTYPCNATQAVDSIDIIFVLGEALRADHLALNGYERETTPMLSAHRNIVSLGNIYSEYTHTMASVPHILTPADSITPEKTRTDASFIRCFALQGFRTAWISNQDKGRTYAAFIAENDTVIYPNASKSVFVFNEWTDADLLPPLDKLIQQQTPRNLYTLHCIGSHWYYNNHVPASMQRFQPITDNRVVTGNTPAQVINSYDNTVLYMDWLLNEIIIRFKDKNALLIYLSDHGEALGEDGHWLHAGGTDSEKHPACVVWYSEQYVQNYPDKVKALCTNKDKRYRTDFLFYSILSAAGIEAEGKNAAFDIFSLQ
ncbi:MAG: lipid A phosphoethanolamine transferase [Paludibacter sp.]|nr:lipid A phosphoethanolamine transferase [Bacteroidales bacterium]MCM1068636.1 lipid A phosphoethanolamine transferase [Prevotella sp.]MCM1353300.1 lipid A phosphoethanolamine transferase [Bacteroides sp.]MCM1442292.1 lipid A phosphoethanolamine transferase [Muribaculum sp.]MCM1481111.1 lipid A phosphoethanolamine transferase [Paludibacter sp.]